MKEIKNIDLFGDENIIIPSTPNRRKKTLFDDYDGFITKFEPKKTTDDCYTPPAVYDCILNYVREHCDIEGCPIIRPFHPGGDYVNETYPSQCVVADNPPFSILGEIVKFYICKNIRFFLFAPHLTLFSPTSDATRIVVGAEITYENGAKVKTSFISNMFDEIGVFSDYQLFRSLEAINELTKVNFSKYQYPYSVLTVSGVSYLLSRGVEVRINKKDMYRINGLDDQKKHKKSIFGAGYLLSERAAERAAAERAAEKATAERAAERATAEQDNTIIWRLSDREKSIIKRLNP